MVNFWTPTPWNIKQLNKGSRLYFMLKAPIRQIGGFGEFIEYRDLTPEQAWNQFGYRNGRTSKHEFINSIQNYIDKNSKKSGSQPIDINTYEIGCIILDNCEFWNNAIFINPADHNIDFATQVVKIKYFDQYDPFMQSQEERDNFNLINEPRENKPTVTNSRERQSEFKGRILKAYHSRCCISGETISELLEAAHVQEYRNTSSNHVQNGLLLRIDIHRLYDNHLLFIDSNYIIHVSNLVTSQQYRQLHGQTITLPDLDYSWPSKEALELRRNEFRS